MALGGNNIFLSWLHKPNHTFSFRFQFPKKKKKGFNEKSIPCRWIIEAKNESNDGVIIDRKWVKKMYGKSAGDCRATVLIWLLENHNI